jgi:hypothetical protein
MRARSLVKNSLYLASVLFYLLPFCRAQPAFSWAHRIGSAYSEDSRQMYIDPWSNVYIVGSFNSTTDFDPGPGIFTLTSTGDDDAYIVKLSPAGNFIWAGRFGGPGKEKANDITGDAWGNIYLTGTFGTGSGDYDPGPGVYPLSTTQPCSNYVVKLNANGGLIWAASYGGFSSGFFDISSVTKITLDQTGNIVLGGAFDGTQDFDPGPGTFTLFAQSGNGDGYILKLSPAGGFLSVKHLRGVSTGAAAVISDIIVNSLGETFVCGILRLTVDFDPGPSTYTLSGSNPPYVDGFIIKLSSSGTLLWAKPIGDNEVTNDVLFTKLAVSSAGDLIAGGFFRDTVDLDPGPGSYTLVSSPYFNSFISAIDPVTGSLQWCKAFVNADNSVSDFHLDYADNIITCGGFQSGTDFDPGPGIFTLNATNPGGLFIVKLSQSGSFLWGFNTGGFPRAFAITPSYDIFVSGMFTGTVNLNPGPSTSTYSSAGSLDVFVYKLSSCPYVPQLGGPVQICSGNAATLTVGALGSVTWHTGMSTSVSIGSGSVFVTPTLSAGTHTYYAASSNCTVESTRLPVVVLVNEQPTLALSASSNTVCLGGQITLSVSGAHVYSVNSTSANAVTNFSLTGILSLTVLGKDTISGCLSSKTMSIAGLPCDGLSEYGWDRLLVYPNPAIEITTFLSSSVEEIQLIDPFGRLLSEYTLSEGKATVDLSALPEGMYYLREKGNRGNGIKVCKIK